MRRKYVYHKTKDAARLIAGHLRVSCTCHGQTMIGDFAKENEKFVNEKKVQQRREDAALPPWVGYHEEDILKDQILELSQVR